MLRIIRFICPIREGEKRAKKIFFVLKFRAVSDVRANFTVYYNVTVIHSQASLNNI